MNSINIDKKIVENIIAVYADAWITQDPEKIVSIFVPNGIYHEFVLEKPYVGHDEIRKYWIDRIISEESNIQFKLLNLYIDGNTAIAEWDAQFTYNKKMIQIREVAIMEIVGNKIASLREYWHSKDL